MNKEVAAGTGEISLLPVSFMEWECAQARRSQREEVFRWGVSFLAVLMVSGGAVAWITRLPPVAVLVPEPPPAAIAIDLAPVPASAPSLPTDVPPGPKQTLSEPDTAPEEPPKIAAPLSPAPTPPVPVPKPEKQRKIVKTHKPATHQKKPVPDRTPPAEQTTAPPSTEALPAPAQAAPAAGASSSHASQSPATWQSDLLARLEKYKRYPAVAMAEHQEGVPMLHFAMDRKGHVLSAQIKNSSGHSLLDQEAVALVHRAEPLPIPPDSVEGDPITLTVPIEFYLE